MEKTLTIIGVVYLLILLSAQIFPSVHSYLKDVHEVDNNKTMEELMTIVKFNCNTTYRNILLPIFNDTGYSNKSQRVGKIINDTTLNNAIIETSNNILEYLSDSFKKKLSYIINPDKLEEFIISLVRDNLTELSLELNQSTIKRMKNS